MPSQRHLAGLAVAPRNGEVNAAIAPVGTRIEVVGRAERVAIDESCQVTSEALPTEIRLTRRRGDALPVDATDALRAAGRREQQADVAASRAWISPPQPPGAFKASVGDWAVTLASRHLDSGWWKPLIHYVGVDDRPCADRWRSIGPAVDPATCFQSGTCDTGRVMDIAFDPDSPARGYAATRGGGVWLTLDAGGTWYAQTDHADLPGGLAVGRVAVAAAAPGESAGRVYAGTGDPHDDWWGWRSADGIRLSTDGGATWRRPACGGPSEPPAGIVTRIRIDPVDAAIVYVATTSGVHVSIDRGECWRNVTANLLTLGAAPIHDLVIAQDGSGPALYAAVPPHSGRICGAVAVMHNPTVAGATWTTSAAASDNARCPALPGTVGRMALAASRATTGDSVFAVVVTHATPFEHVSVFQRRIDPVAGASWSRRTDPTVDGCVPGNQRCQGQCLGTAIGLSVDPVAPCDLLVSTQFAVMQSDDCGVNWQGWDTRDPLNPLHDDNHMVVHHPTSGVAYLGGDGGLAAINMAIQPAPVDGCKAAQPALDCTVPLNCWTLRNGGFVTDQFYNIAVSDAADFVAGTAGGLQDNATRIRRSAASASDWIQVSGGDGGASALDAYDSDVAYVKAYPWGPGWAERLHDVRGLGNSGVNASHSVGTVSALWADPFRDALLARLEDGQLYYAEDARSVAPGQDGGWRCLDPTPGNLRDAVDAVEFVRKGEYLVSTNEWLGTGAAARDVGTIHLVRLGSGNAPGPCTASSNADATVALDPSLGLGRVNDIAIDPHTVPGSVRFYAALLPPAGQERFRIVRIGPTPADDWVVSPIAPATPLLAQTSNFWANETVWKHLAAHPVRDHTLYVGTDNGLIVGERTGLDDTTWTWRQSPGVAQTLVSDLAVRRGDARGIVRASTYGRGVWEHQGRQCRPFPDREIEPPVHVPVPPPIDPFVRHDAVMIPVSYSYEGRDGDEAILRVLPTRAGTPAPGFLAEQVRVREGSHPAIAAIVYADASGPPAADTDGLAVMLTSERGDLLAFRHVPARIGWRRADMRSLRVAVEVEREGGPRRLPVRGRLIQRGERARTFEAPDILVARHGDEIRIAMPDTIQAPEGRARFGGWQHVTLNDGEGSARVLASDLRRPEVRLRVEADIALVAHYVLERDEEDEPRERRRLLPGAAPPSTHTGAGGDRAPGRRS
jgi:hypothetical protein